LRYTDPSGNAFNDGKDCANCGPTEVQQTAIGNGIKTIKDNWDDWGIKDWSKKNLNFNSWGRSWNKFWGKDRTPNPPPNMSSYASLNNYSNNNFSFKAANIQVARENYLVNNVNDNNSEGLLLAALGYGTSNSVNVLKGSTFRLFNQQGKNFAPKLYESGWLGGSRGQIKTYGTSKAVAGLKIGGYGLGMYNAASIQSQYNSGEIDKIQATLEHSSNAYSTFGGLYGAAWGVGWESGRAVTKLTAYQKWKQEVWFPFREETFGY